MYIVCFSSIFANIIIQVVQTSILCQCGAYKKSNNLPFPIQFFTFHTTKYRKMLPISVKTVWHCYLGQKKDTLDLIRSKSSIRKFRNPYFSDDRQKQPERCTHSQSTFALNTFMCFFIYYILTFDCIDLTLIKKLKCTICD